ncbi:MAG: type II secretion system protein GspL, partial [Pseudomonadota bacterium]
MLLRCIDIGIFKLPNGQTVNTADLAAMHGKLLSSVRGKNAAEGNTDYILTIPAHRCLLTSVPVTKHESRLLRKTLPWVLEERLLEPVET